MDVVFKNANFWVDKEGILIFTDIEKKGDVSKAEVVYDGKNAVVLNRNDEDFYALRNIAPRLRQRLADAKSVVIVEHSNGEMYSYEVVLRKVDDLGIKDDWDEYASKFLAELKEKLPQENVEQFMKEAENFLEYVENN